MKPLLRLLTGAVLMCAASELRAQHFHLNAGAPIQAQDSPIYFRNGSDFATNSNFALPLVYTTNGTYAGYYSSSSLSLTAIGTGFFNAPAPGSQLRLRFIEVSGPAGGSFGVWDVDGFNFDEDPATALTFSVSTGTTNGTNSILLSQNNGEPGADTFGHIHGRVYSATKPGLYVVKIQAYDASANGTGGGPIHSPSELLPIYFQAGDTIASIDRGIDSTRLGFATQLGRSYYVEYTVHLTDPESWQNAAGPLAGDNHLQTVSDPDFGADRRFYRLRITTP